MSLRLEGVRAGYGPVEVLHGVDLEFPAGVVVALLGQNGSGTSTVLRCVAGTVRPRAGTVRWDGVDITRRTGYQRSSAGLCYVPDEHGAFGTLTVRENLALFGRPRPVTEVIAAALEVFPELERLLDHRVATLSGGERQMVALCRVVARPWRAVLVDEMSRGLTATVAARFVEWLRAGVTSERVTVLCDQFVDTALAVADLVYVLRRGTVTFRGSPAELDDARLIAALH